MKGAEGEKLVREEQREKPSMLWKAANSDQGRRHEGNNHSKIEFILLYSVFFSITVFMQE